MFDQAKMLKKCVKVIEKVGRRHPHEAFYAFAIDASLLCLNTEEGFAECLSEYQRRSPERYSEDEHIQHLRFNPADWRYTRIAALRWWNGFDAGAYQDHYEKQMKQPNQKLQTQYRKAMMKLLEAVKASGVLDKLRKTDDFRLFLAEHEY